MNEYIPQWLLLWFETKLVVTYSRAILLLLLGVPLSYSIARRLQKFLSGRYTPQHGLIAGQITRYGGSAIFITAGLNQMGFSLAPLLGAAGVIGVAVGFASQTSASNIISGLFILMEEPFKIGDVITAGETTGEVISIDLLSVKIRSFDNRFVRIPHETILKSEVTNLTRFPIRRVDIKIPVAYKEDVACVKKIILDVVAEDVRVLKLPEPLVFFKNFGTSSIELVLFAWAEKHEWFAVRNTLPERIKECFDEKGIEMPFPHLKIYRHDEPVKVKSSPNVDSPITG